MLVTHRNILVSYGIKEAKYEEDANHADSLSLKNIYSYEVIDY